MTKKINNVQQKNYNPEVIQVSPVIPEFALVTKKDEDGADIMEWKETDTKQVLTELGTAQDWCLSALLKAGINPQSMSVHTGYNSRIEGIDDLSAFEAAAEAALMPPTEENNKE